MTKNIHEFLWWEVFEIIKNLKLLIQWKIFRKFAIKVSKQKNSNSKNVYVLKKIFLLKLFAFQNNLKFK